MPCYCWIILVQLRFSHISFLSKNHNGAHLAIFPPTNLSNNFMALICQIFMPVTRIE